MCVPYYVYLLLTFLHISCKTDVWKQQSEKWLGLNVCVCVCKCPGNYQVTQGLVLTCEKHRLTSCCYGNITWSMLTGLSSAPHRPHLDTHFIQGLQVDLKWHLLMTIRVVQHYVTHMLHTHTHAFAAWLMALLSYLIQWRSHTWRHQGTCGLQRSEMFALRIACS